MVAVNRDEMRARRAMLGWRQADLAERLGVTREYVARIESGKQTPGEDTMQRIEALLADAGIGREDTPECGRITGHGECEIHLVVDVPFSLRVAGPSSYPLGVVVDPQAGVMSGDLAVVREKKTGRVWIGVVTLGDDDVTIHPDASDGVVTIARAGARIAGKVTWVDMR